MSDHNLPTRMPVVFIGHGSPMNAIEESPFRAVWETLGRLLPRPKAILCISAHWETRGVYLTAVDNPETIHDFYGFPKELTDIQYRAPGSPQLARNIADRVQWPRLRLDPGRGLDHGAWSVLRSMFPDADVPVVQMSLDLGQPPAFHYELGRKLDFLRNEGVLVIGSGNIVHNLRLFRWHDPTPMVWGIRFDAGIKRHILGGDHAAIANYLAFGSDAAISVNSTEHYLPLLYVLAMQGPSERPVVFNEEVVSAISMTSYAFGLEPQAASELERSSTGVVADPVLYSERPPA